MNCEFDPEIEAEFPTNMSGKLTIEARGQTFVRKVVVPKGEPSNFLTENELRAKFHGLTDAVLGEDQAARLADAVLGLHRSNDVARADHPRRTARPRAAGGRGIGPVRAGSMPVAPAAAGSPFPAPETSRATPA